MKKSIIFFLSCLSVLTSTAQTIGEAFYIYRNDGQFNAFFRTEIDSIAYSNYDADGNWYEDVVTQRVYTQDSLYQIPLAAIDSVGFVTPETIVNDDVFPLTAEHSPYIFDADTLQFYMLLSTPEALRPQVGNIVVGTADCMAFSDGIIGKVESIETLGNGYYYHCSLATIDDVFDQLVVYSQQMESGDSQGESRSFDMNRASLTAELWNYNWTHSITGGGTTTTLNVGDQAIVTVIARKTLTTPFFFQLQLQNALTSSIDFNAKSSVGYFAEKQIGSTISVGRIKVPYTAGILWFAPKLSLYGYFQEEGSVELNYSGHFNRTDKVVFTYTEGKWSFNHAPTTSAGTDIAKLSMEGYAEVGLRPQIDFSLNGRKAGFGMNARVGLKEYINFVFDITQLSNGGLYDAMRDSYCRTTIPWSLTAHASADIFRKYDSNFMDVGPATISYTYEPNEEPQWGDDRYIFPLFADVSAESQNGSTVHASASVSRTPLLPVQLGFSILDGDNNILQTQYDSRTYQAGSLFPNYSLNFSDISSYDELIVRPSVKLFGQDVLASPSANIEHSCPDNNHPHMIDLGLPSGTKWACCNVGATTPEGYGNYYAWGETQPKSEYNWDTYQYGYYNGDGDYSHLVNIGSDIAGTSYDAATVNWGAPWRMPSLTQIQELLNKCSSEWTTQNGVSGRKFTGPNGGSIFLPAAGGRWGSGLYGAGASGGYWSSSLDESDPGYACGLGFYSGYAGWGSNYRGSGLSVRPVR